MTTEIPLNDEGEPMTAEEIAEQADYERAHKEHYASWLQAQKPGKYTAIVHGTSGIESPEFSSVAECEKWVSENLPVGIQKCRTQSYSIEKI